MDRTTKEIGTHKCLGASEATSVGIAQCAPSYCVSEISPRVY